MPSINTYTIMRWRVDWNNNTPVVNPVENAQLQVPMLVADGATSTDIQVLAAYLLQLPAAQREEAIQAMRDGLVTVTPVSKAQVATPPVPPRVQIEGPPARAARA